MKERNVRIATDVSSIKKKVVCNSHPPNVGGMLLALVALVVQFVCSDIC